jgi:hypothetical protein
MARYEKNEIYLLIWLLIWIGDNYYVVKIDFRPFGFNEVVFPQSAGEAIQ